MAVRSPSSGTAPAVRPAWSHIPDAPSRTPAGTRTARPPACPARVAAAARAGHAGWRHPRASRRCRSRAGPTYPPEPRLLPATCGNGVRIDGSRSAAPASSLSSADTGKRPSESCLPPIHSPCAPSSGQYTASWQHDSRSPVLRRIHKGLRQYRLQAVPLLPVPGQPPNRHRQGLRGQIRNPNPRENQEPGVAHHPLQTLRPIPIPIPPAHPGVTTGQPGRARLKQQTAQLATPTIPQPVTQETAERMPVTQLMMPIHPFLPFLNGLPLSHNLQFQRHQLLQPARYGGARIRAARMPRSPTSGSRSRSRPLRRQRHDPASLQLLQHPQTGPQPIPTLRREPAQMTAQGGSQLMAAQRRKHFHRLLKVCNLTAGPPRATEGGRLQLLDSGIHHVGTRDNLTKRRLP